MSGVHFNLLTQPLIRSVEVIFHVSMEYSVKEKVTITAWIIASPHGVSVEENRQRFRNEFQKEAPPRQTLIDWKNKLLETGSLVQRQSGQGRRRTASGEEKSQRVLESIERDNSTSTRRLSAELNMSKSSVHRILQENQMHPYKPLYSQDLYDGDDDRRRQFSEIMNIRFQNDPAFLRKLTFSDECVFHLHGSVNKHNIHYWASQNPQFRITNPGQTSALTVWVCISFSGIVAVDISRQTMNGDRYCLILQEKVIPYFKRHNHMLFQQDGAPPHYCVNARQILNENIPQQWIGRRGHIEWPARSPDLTVCDFWLWAYLRDRVYQPAGVTFRSVTELENRIHQELNAIPLRMFRDAFRNFQKRCQLCIDVDGNHFEC